MKRYTFSVTETHLVKATYIVEADSREEAEAKAEIGDTVEEIPGGLMEVSGREVTALDSEG